MQHSTATVPSVRLYVCPSVTRYYSD